MLHPLCSSSNIISTITITLTSTAFQRLLFFSANARNRDAGHQYRLNHLQKCPLIIIKSPQLSCGCLGTWLVQCLKHNDICYREKSLQSSPILQYSPSSKATRISQQAAPISSTSFFWPRSYLLLSVNSETAEHLRTLLATQDATSRSHISNI